MWDDYCHLISCPPYDASLLRFHGASSFSRSLTPRLNNGSSVSSFITHLCNYVAPAVSSLPCQKFHLSPWSCIGGFFLIWQLWSKAGITPDKHTAHSKIHRLSISLVRSCRSEPPLHCGIYPQCLFSLTFCFFLALVSRSGLCYLNSFHYMSLPRQ